ncbi:MAG: ABC transporter substrate-binding protein [Clostridiales bacterium]|jgi:sulfonate transport system substrate-binding protein|nr:ABC transporter substrate-binding protein [Clostridiales bacterium]OPZ69703.1 MAG: putative ABC transporter periplasmic binding protein precursor [Firmicutes bacterium ADurb.Bin467]
MKKLLVLLLALVLILSSFALAEKAPIVVNMGILDGWTGFPTKYIVDNGMDLEAGIDIEYLVFSSGAPANEAMIAGDIDCAIIGGGASVPALANLNSKMIMEVNNDTIGMSLIARPDLACASVSGAVPALPEVKGDAESVRGTTILTTAGTLQYYCTLKYLEAIGLSVDDVNLVSMDANQAYQAFALGEGDILTCSNSYSFDLVKEGNVELGSLTSLNCSATAQVVCSEKAFNDPEKFEGLTILCQVLAKVNDIMNADADLATENYVNWVALNGGKLKESTARSIMEAKPYFGVQAAKERELGADFLNNFVEFYILTEQIEPEQREVIEANVRDDVLKAAGLK